MSMPASKRPFRSYGPPVENSLMLHSHTEGPVLADFNPSHYENDDDNNNNNKNHTNKHSTSNYGHGNTAAPYEKRFSPYEFNGGTVAAITGKDFCIIAADTRLSSGYEILSRNMTKLHPLTSKCVLGSSGCKTDVDQLRSVLDINMKVYEHNHGKPMSTQSVAQLLSNTLYYKRFFPYYAFNILAGVDESGKGVVYAYDAIGSYECSDWYANGSGQAFIIPLLDNVVGNRNRTGPKPDLSAEEVVEIFKDAFLSAGERDIYTGDQVEITVIRADSCTTTTFALKAD